MKYGIAELNWTFWFQMFNTILLLAFLIIVFIGVPYYMIKRLKKMNGIEKRLSVIEEKLEKLENGTND